MQTTEIITRAAEVIQRCLKLASFSEDSGSTRRTFLSPPMHDCHQEIARWMEPLGSEVRIDAAGNLRGVYPATQPNALRLLIGSHLDTVPNAGAYDGILGVVLAVALLEELRGRRLPFAIEVVGFSEEEGVRFGTPFIGSRALVGRLDEELLDLQDARSISMRKAIQEFGLDPAEISRAELQRDVIGYLEFHIEQGPVLERLNLPLAAVEGIAGQTRLELTFLGHANHAGTTPMHFRCDAIAGAAQWIGVVERCALEVPGLVATVGKIDAKPGATNVIAGQARLTLDVRHLSDEIRTRAVGELLRQAQGIATHRGLTVRESRLLSQPAVSLDPFFIGEIEQAIAKAGCTRHRMVSGAGHDAMIMAEKVPSAMIFLRSPGGISHDPAESVTQDDVEKAIVCGLHLLDQLASSPEFYKRTNCA
ncbi:MAG TPA: allantoate amidohydrolase [Candidatus Sulfotelmatobacter sp.]